LGEILENLTTVPENPDKISEDVDKLPEILVKNGTQRCWTSKHCAQPLQKNTWRPFFLEATSKKGLRDFCLRKYVGICQNL